MIMSSKNYVYNLWLWIGCSKKCREDQLVGTSRTFKSGLQSPHPPVHSKSRSGFYSMEFWNSELMTWTHEFRINDVDTRKIFEIIESASVTHACRKFKIQICVEVWY